MAYKKASGALVLLLVYAASALFFMAISGAAPVNDEGAYAKTAKIAAEEHRLQYPRVTEPIALVPIGWGALFLALTGFSLTTLRISILIFSLFGGLGFYWLLKELGLDEASAVLGPLVMFVYPEFFAGSFEFMTDVPYVCLLLFGLLFYLRGLARQRNELLLLGSVFSFAACMTRQPGILIPVCVAAFLILTRRKLRPVQWFLTVILPLLADLAGLYWYYSRPERMEHGVHNLPGIPLYLETAFYVVIYSGLLCLPLTVGMAAKLTANRDTRARFGKYFLLWCAVLGGILAGISWQAGAFLPFSFPLAPIGQSYNGSVGTVYAYVLKEELPFELPPIALKGLFLISLASAGSLLSLLSMTIASSPAVASALRRFPGLRKRRVFLAAGAIAAVAWFVGFLSRDLAFAVGRRIYDLQRHIHTFNENLPRIARAYDSLLADVGFVAIGFLALQFLPRLQDREGLSPEASPRRMTGNPFNGCDLVYLVYLGQALFVLLVTSITVPFVFRRYVLIFAPGLLSFVLTRRKDFQSSKFVAVGSIALLALYAAFTTRGVMRYTEARWQGASYLLERGVLAPDINAGLSFNNWYLDAPLAASYDSRYLVISSPFPGYRELKKIPVPGGLSGDLNVYVLERKK